MEGSVEELSAYRFEMSTEAFADALIMFENGRYKNTLNRGYYAIFHAIRAVNALSGFDSSKHSGVIAYFNQHYVKERVFPSDIYKLISDASVNCEKADYRDFFVASKEQAKEQIDRAEVFRKHVAEYLKKQGILNSDNEEMKR